jgi:arylsulfatase A-like enzyme
MAEPAARPHVPNLALARWLVLGVFLAVAACGLRIAVYLAATAFDRDFRYVVGCFEGIGIDIGFGLVVAAPVLLGGRVGTALAGALAVVLLFANSAGAHFHAMFLHLPTRDALEFLRNLKVLESSINEHAPVGALLAESVLPAALAFGLAERFAPRLAAALSRPRRFALASAAVAATVLASTVRTTAVYGQEYYGAIGPVVHVTKRNTASDLVPGTPPRLDVIAGVQHAIATDNPGPPVDPSYPLCSRGAPAPSSGKTGRSALLLILESIDIRSFDLEIGGAPVMPNIRRMSKDGVLFSRFFSTGNMSVYALPALFGGLPAAPARALLLMTPLDRVLGFPAALRREGYDTAYMHADDLTFSHQDEFVRRVGFEHVVPMPVGLPRYGWGAADAALFAELRAYIERQRQGGDKPFFATAFTVSTHDPYTLPPDHPRRFGGSKEFDRFTEALAYLDGELGRFYDWFAANELPRGTVLAVTGDHAPRLSFPNDPVDTTTGEFEYRFQVPLILLGLNEDEARRARANAAGAIGGHHDLPATLATALGVVPPRCHQGRSLLGADVPAVRIVPSVAGESLEFLYAHEGTRRFMLELRTGRFREYDYVSDPTFRRDLAASDPRAPEVREFLHGYHDLMHYAIMRDKLAPPIDEAPKRAALSRVAAAERVLRGTPPLGTAPGGDVGADLERALEARPEWLELSIAPNGRGALVVRRWKEPAPASPSDPSYVPVPDTIAEGPPLDEVLARIGGRASLFLDVERPARFPDIMNVVHGMVAAVGRLPENVRVVVESSDEVMLTSIRQFSAVSLAYRIAPIAVSDKALSFAAERGFTWVSIAEEYATPDAIAGAHAHGLRVLTYPRAAPPAGAPTAELPDARVVN